MIPPEEEKVKGLEEVQKATLNILEDFDQERARLVETQRAALNILEDFSSEKARLEGAQKATLNILEDFDAEKGKLGETQRAVLNILDDFNLEKAHLEGSQKATLNILEDFSTERVKLEEVQRAMLNILDDSSLEKLRLEKTQKATLNILEDFDAEKLRLQETQRASMNILEDFETEKAKVEKANRMLEEKQAELTRSNQELEQFAYVASHDLQEPLRMVASFVQLLAQRYRGKLGKEADEFIAFAVDGAKRMQGLINDLLTFSRVGTQAKPFSPTDCQAVLEQALQNLQVAIQERGAVVTHDFLPTVMADDVQLTQLFQNLIANSIKFCPEKRPEIQIGATLEGAEWQFSFRDNGIGINPKFHDRIFVIFQRLHTRKEYPGTGIGLAVCKKIVERHGGRIWVESEPGQGACFYFTLPARGGEPR